jgi:hypothetical protein
MARTLIEVDKTSKGGLDFIIDTAVDSANGMEFVNSGNEIMFVENSDTVDHTVTVDYKMDKFGRDGNDQIVVPAGKTFALGTFYTQLYNQNKNKVLIDFDASTGLAVAVVQV